MTYVPAPRDASGRYPGIGIAYTKLTREECEALKNAKVSVNTSNEHTEHDAQEATATYSDTRIKEITGVGHLFPARPVITFEELTYGKGARKCYVATISKVVTEGSHVIDLHNDIEFLIAGDFQAIPGVTYTVADYDTTTRKVTVTPLGE